MKYSCAEINKVLDGKLCMTYIQYIDPYRERERDTSELILTKRYDDGHTELRAVSA